MKWLNTEHTMKSRYWVQSLFSFHPNTLKCQKSIDHICQRSSQTPANPDSHAQQTRVSMCVNTDVSLNPDRKRQQTSDGVKQAVLNEALSSEESSFFPPLIQVCLREIKSGSSKIHSSLYAGGPCILTFYRSDSQELFIGDETIPLHHYQLSIPQSVITRRGKASLSFSVSTENGFNFPAGPHFHPPVYVLPFII